MTTHDLNRLPILYSFRRCPYAIRARMALICTDIVVEHREVSLKEKPPSMLLASPKGTVPVLVLPNETVIDESFNIMLWAFNQTKNLPNHWLGNDRSLLTEAEILHWHFEGEFKNVLDHYKYADRHQHPPVHYRTQALPFLAQLEEKLLKNDYLFGDMISIVDIMIMPFIRQFAYVDRSWFDQSPYLNLISWLDRILQLKIFIAAMEKKALWVDPAIEYSCSKNQ